MNKQNIQVPPNASKTLDKEYLEEMLLWVNSGLIDNDEETLSDENFSLVWNEMNEHMLGFLSDCSRAVEQWLERQKNASSEDSNTAL